MAVQSEVKLSKVMNADRLDADYYKPCDIHIIHALDKLKAKPLTELCQILNGKTPSDYEESGSMAVVRSGDLVSQLIYPDCGRSFLHAPQTPDRVHLKKGDVLISSIGMGSIGKISLVVNPDDCITVSEVTILRNLKYPPEYVLAYLSSPVGQSQIEREITGATGQQHLLKSKVGKIRIPPPPPKLLIKLKNCIQNAYAAQQRARSTFMDAEEMFSKELGVKDFDFCPALYYEQSFIKVRQSNRLDAEYFMPIKRQILDELALLPHKPVSFFFQSVRDLFPTRQCPLDKTVRNYNLTNALIPYLDDSVDPIEASEIGSTKKRIEPNDIVISRLRSYLKEIAIVYPAGDIEQIASTEFIVLRRQTDKVTPEALLVYLRSPWIQAVLKWCQDGSNHPRFQDIEILTLPFPNSIISMQDKLTELVQASYNARKQARHQLEEATHTVAETVLGGK